MCFPPSLYAVSVILRTRVCFGICHKLALSFIYPSAITDERLSRRSCISIVASGMQCGLRLIKVLVVADFVQWMACRRWLVLQAPELEENSQVV